MADRHDGTTLPAPALTPAEVSRHDYPDVWIREARGGYGYVQHVPCRVLTQTAKRIKIRVPRADGTIACRYVRAENIKLDARVF